MKNIEKLNASIAILNQKLNNIHFNYKGNNFREVHLFTEELYKKNLELYDELSEKIAMRNMVVRASFQEHLEDSIIEDIKGQRLSKEEISSILVEDITNIIHLAEKVETSSVIQPLLDEIYLVLDKYRWIFRSIV